MDVVFPVMALLLLAAIAGLLIVLLLRQRAPVALPPELSVQMATLERQLQAIARQTSEEARAGRDELRSHASAQTEVLDRRLTGFDVRFAEFGTTLGGEFSTMRGETLDSRQKLEDAVRQSSESFAKTQTERLGETNLSMQQLAERLTGAHKDLRDTQAAGLAEAIAAIRTLMEQNNNRHEALKAAVGESLDKVRSENAQKLDEMRQTVDEKLQGTLEKRLGESFQLVSDRLEQVHRGLGEMQTLATGVGDLKRIMGNVKSRGGWGEAQLGMLLADMLTPEQFAANVRVRPDSGEIVEFAVKLPGRGDTDAPLWLPIDSKLPNEDYDRLLSAQDAGTPEDIERSAQALDRAIRVQAKIVSDKYVHPPFSTDFAILYLPTEGLFAEVLRRPGLASEIQNKYRIMIQGPTTLAALLTSLQMGFRTLAIEKRSSEVWQILAAAKAEFEKYGTVWEKLGKQLETAKRTVDEAGKRTRAVNRKLRDVDTLSIQSSSPLLEVIGPDESDDTDGEDSVGEETDSAEAKAAE